ncbi:Cap15 family cyclic dinucleotide receptor domain-containing protein [Salinibacillus xinjiangensis]|uniref:Cap15 family cyclic dinucleotide receptor domain-containing protein n=1 Tax=Salinibacillus xinjiangensis TaxID=1229268 RepID=UPI00389A22AF
MLTPNLIGTWKGNFRSSFFEFKDEFPAELIIEQTWTEICIQGKFRHSKSSSYTTSIKVRDGAKVKLFYSYQNEKNPEQSNKPFSDHKGYGSLIINEKEQKIEGYYFNNPSNNNNHGILHLTRVS